MECDWLSSLRFSCSASLGAGQRPLLRGDVTCLPPSYLLTEGSLSAIRLQRCECEFVRCREQPTHTVHSLLGVGFTVQGLGLGTIPQLWYIRNQGNGRSLHADFQLFCVKAGHKISLTYLSYKYTMTPSPQRVCLKGRNVTQGPKMI